MYQGLHDCSRKLRILKVYTPQGRWTPYRYIHGDLRLVGSLTPKPGDITRYKPSSHIGTSRYIQTPKRKAPGVFPPIRSVDRRLTANIDDHAQFVQLASSSAIKIQLLLCYSKQILWGIEAWNLRERTLTP